MTKEFSSGHSPRFLKTSRSSTCIGGTVGSRFLSNQTQYYIYRVPCQRSTWNYADRPLTPETLRLRHLVNLNFRHPFPSSTALLDLVASNPLLGTVPRPDGAVAIPRLSSLLAFAVIPQVLYPQRSGPPRFSRTPKESIGGKALVRSTQV